MSHALADRPVTIAEFEAFIGAQPHETKWELVDGHIFAMTNPLEDHGQIALNLAAPLKAEAERSGCRVNVGGIRVQASEDGLGVTAMIPDITVRCGERVARSWVMDPVIVVEVLSPSTMDYDRGRKLDFYKSLPSLADIVLIYQDEVRVEHYSRGNEGWLMKPLNALTDLLTLTSLPSSNNLDGIYAGSALA